MSDIPTIKRLSKDGSKVFVTPGDDTARGIWVDAGTPLETVRFPPPRRDLPTLTIAPWGAGKGIKGGVRSTKILGE
jgi:hypothetical protein